MLTRPTRWLLALGAFAASSGVARAQAPGMPAATDTAALPTPPIPQTIPKTDTTLGNMRDDNYFWLRDDSRNSPDGIAYLKALDRYGRAGAGRTATPPSRPSNERKP